MGVRKVKTDKVPAEAELREAWKRVGNVRKLSQILQVNEAALRAEIDRLGLRPPPVRFEKIKRIPPPDELICETYKRVQSIKKTAKEIGWSHRWVKERLVSCGVKIKRHTGPAKTVCFTCANATPIKCAFIRAYPSQAEKCLEAIGATWISCEGICVVKLCPDHRPGELPALDTRQRGIVFLTESSQACEVGL